MEIDRYKKVFTNHNEYVTCDFSILIPSWKLEASTWDVNLFKSAIEYAESKNYYSFYTTVSLDKLDSYRDFVNTVAQNYSVIVEEIVPENEKSINLLFWDWLFLSTSFNKKMCVIYHILTQNYRDE